MRKNLIKILILILGLIMFVGCGNEIQSKQEEYEGMTYKISYIYDSELLDLNPNFYIYGESQTLPTPDIKGFDGWYTSKDLTGEGVTEISNTDHGNKIYYAKVDESKIVYSIKYYDGTSELSLTPNSYNKGSSFALPIPSEKEGYEFKGWYSEKTYENQVIDIKNTDTEDKVFYARYIATISYVSANASIFRDVVKSVNGGKGVDDAITTSGDVKVLVIPVDFTDYPADATLVQTIDVAFNGSETDTGWESLKTYYQESSYGKLNITATVSSVYHTGKNTSYYEKQDEVEAVNNIIQSALQGLDSSINYADFDNDKDGDIDAVYFIYTAPVDYEGYTSDLWWAYCDQYENNTEKYDGVNLNYYMFAGTDFFSETPANEMNYKVNAETFIHETGHLLGLDDYYDYDTSDRINKGGIGGGDMMDYNVGDHNPYSKAILGWITPQLINLSEDGNEYNVELRSFGKTGDALIIARKNITSYYDEYYIVDFYTPDGLNETSAGVNGLFAVSGVRIYHITATLATGKVESMWDVTKYNNADAKFKLIKLIEADQGNDIDNEGESEDSDLFQAGDKYTKLKWNDGTSLNISFNVLSTTSEKATIQIVKTK